MSVKTKEWGNSIGIIIPRRAVEELGIAVGEEIIIDIRKKQNVLKELFGAIPLKRKTEGILKDVREELEGDLI